MTLKCRCCDKHFTPIFPRRYPDSPGCYCDECAELDEETRPPDPLQEKICDLKIGGSLFFPITPQDPRPWETLKAEIKRPRWTYLSGGGLCVHPVQQGDPYIDEQDFISFETENGARLFKSLTFKDLSLGVGLEFAKKPVQSADERTVAHGSTANGTHRGAAG